MERRQKDHIKKHLPSLISMTDCSTNVLSVLLSKDVLSKSDVEALKTHAGKDERVLQLYAILETRIGSYEAFIEALEETKQTGAVKILSGLDVNSDPDLVKIENEKLLKRPSCCHRPDSRTAIKILDVIINILKAEAVPLEKIQEIFRQRTVIDQVDKIVRYCGEASASQTGNGNASKILNQGDGENTSNKSLNILGSKAIKAVHEQCTTPIGKINFVSPDGRRVSRTSEIIQVEPIFATELSQNAAHVMFNNSQLELLVHITLSSNTSPFATLTKSFRKKLKEHYLKFLKLELNTLKTTYCRTLIRELVKKNDAVSDQVLKKFCENSSDKTMIRCLILSYMKKCFWKRILTSNLLSIQVESDLDLPVLGIDLGTNSTVAGHFNKNNTFHNLGISICGNLRIPSYLYFNSEGRAKFCHNKYGNNVVFDIKHLLGMDRMLLQGYLITWPFEIMDEDNFVKVHLKDNYCYFPEEILATYLIQLIGKRKFQNLVLTVPNMFNSRQRMAVLNSMAIARISNCEIVNEGTAAIFAYVHEKLKEITKWRNVLRETVQSVGYFSFGGGCLNISLAKVDFIKKTIEVLVQGGDANLGGRNIDKSLLELCVDKLKESENPTSWEMSGKEKDIYRNINGKLKDIKETLPSGETVTVDVDAIQAEITLHASDLNNICKPIVDYAGEMMKDMLQSNQHATSAGRNDVDHVILLGGLSRMQIMSDKINESFGEGLTSHSNSEDLIAKGAALFGSEYDNDHNPFRLVSNQEILPFHIFAQFVSTSSTLKRTDLLHIAKRNTRIPVRYKLRHELRDPPVQLLIFQSESMEQPKAHLVGEYEIASQGTLNNMEVVKVKVVIDIRRNCTLQIQACCRISDNSKEDVYVILENKLNFSEKKISELADKLKQ